MEGSGEKIIPGRNMNSFADGKIIPGKDNAGPQDDKIIPGVATPGVDTPGESTPGNAPHQAGTKPQPDKQTDISELIAASTRAGGLQVIPPDFDNRNGSWSSISSADPFEILYLDYRQYKTITPEMVQKNYRIISEFWADKLLIMNRGARDQIEKKYTAAVVNGAERRLEAALNKLKTPASLELSFQQVDGKRLETGFAAISELIEISVQDGHITENQANVIIVKGLKNGLEAHEIEGRIISIIKEKGFKPRKEIDKSRTFRNLWMTDDAWITYQRREIKVEWLGEYAYNLEDVGEITFRKKAESEFYFRNGNYLPSIVSRLTDSASRAAEFERIIEEEKDTDKKYLKILYHLHPALPFRFRGSVYSDIHKLFDDAVQAPESFWMAAALFSKDHFRIWLNESAPQVAMLMPETKDVIAFLTFLYAVNRHYPFYLNNSKFTSPEDLARAMKVNQGIWVNVAQHMENGHLPAWFKSIGRADINGRYNAHLEAIINAGLYDA
ncbi:hypothetical protein, partial [Dyadobacter sp.]|uniref:hypothetical protein n=1 Tax=Dyadobacter sp. TaxID=1914288 RepID=UPI003F6F8288